MEKTLIKLKVEIKPFLISVSLLVLTETAVSLIISQSQMHPLVMVGVVRLLESILLILVFHLWGTGLSSIGLGRSQIYPGVKRGVLWSLGFGTVVLFGFGIIFLCGMNPLTLAHVRLPKDPREIFIYFLVGGLISPIAEEVFFRGILYGFLRRWGMTIALFVSTLVFVFLHSFKGLPITQMVGGILFAMAYEVEKKLMAPIAIHVLGNLAIFTLSLSA